MWGYVFGQEKLVTAASLLPWVASQACTVLEEFENSYLAERCLRFVFKGKTVCDKWPLVFLN